MPRSNPKATKERDRRRAAEHRAEAAEARVAELEREKRALLDSVADLEGKWEAEAAHAMSATHFACPQRHLDAAREGEGSDEERD